MNIPTPVGYAELLSGIKEQVRAARVRAGLAVNSELIMLYWRIGRDILDRQEALGWGSEVISQLADDLRRLFISQSQIYETIGKILVKRRKRATACGPNSLGPRPPAP